MNPTDFLSFDIDGIKVNVGITTWTKNFVGAVTDEGRIIRKKAILNQITQYLQQIS